MEILCCFGGLGYFSAEIKEMGLLAQGRGKRSHSHFPIFACVASVSAHGCWPNSSWSQAPGQGQARARAGLTHPHHEPLPPASPSAGTAWGSGQLSPFTRVLLARSLPACPGVLRGCWAHGCAPDLPLSRAGGETRRALPRDKSQGCALLSWRRHHRIFIYASLCRV